MRIDMFVYNRCTTDARVLKEAETLASAGHDVRIVAVLDPTTDAEERRDGFRIVRIERRPIHYRALGAVRRLGRLARRGASGAIEPRERQSSSFGASSLLLLPFALAARAGRPARKPLGAVARAVESAIRKALLLPHKPLMFLDYYRRAYALVRADPPDALHAHDLNTLPVAAALARRLRVQLVYDAHELYPEISTLSRREAAIWRLVERRLARHATAVLTVCESIATELERRNGVRRPNVLLNCPPAVEIDADAGARLRARLGLHELEPVVLYQGGFSPNRGLTALVRAARHLERGTIVLMGWGALADELHSLVRGEGLEKRVMLTDPVPREEVIPQAAGATVGVIPYEPVGLNNAFTAPNKLFDYMAAGLPIAGSRLPELVRFVEWEGVGLTFRPGDPAALGAAVNRLLSDPELYAATRQRALEARRRYTWERESVKLLDLYRE